MMMIIEINRVKQTVQKDMKIDNAKMCQSYRKRGIVQKGLGKHQKPASPKAGLLLTRSTHETMEPRFCTRIASLIPHQEIPHAMGQCQVNWMYVYRSIQNTTTRNTRRSPAPRCRARPGQAALVVPKFNGVSRGVVVGRVWCSSRVVQGQAPHRNPKQCCRSVVVWGPV